MNRLFVFSVIVLFLYLLTVRGRWGVPSVEEIDFRLNSSGKPFETSQERSRYAIILSLVNDRSVSIDNYASMGTPDIGKINGHYYSFFPPTISLMAIPFYLLGIQIGAAQITTFLISTVFAVLTGLVIYKFGRKLGWTQAVAFFSWMVFAFATNAWGYSVTFYAHLVSAFFLISATYVVIFNEDNSWRKSLVFWLIYGIAVWVDYPNVFSFLPLAVMNLSKLFLVANFVDGYKLKINLAHLFTPIIFITFLVGYGYYNYQLFGHPLRLSNAIPRVRDLKVVQNVSTEVEKKALGILQTRNLLEGLRSFTLSHDRGVLVYSPIMILAALGLIYFSRRRSHVGVVLLLIAANNLLLYSMFGDPYGGWSFGSRYMIAVVPQLAILIGAGLVEFRKKLLVKLIYSVVFTISVAISLLSPLTTNVIAPFVEARNLGLDSWFIINWRMLINNELNSFVYNYLLGGNVSGLSYYLATLLLVLVVGLTLIWKSHSQKNI